MSQSNDARFILANRWIPELRQFAVKYTAIDGLCSLSLIYNPLLMVPAVTGES